VKNNYGISQGPTVQLSLKQNYKSVDGILLGLSYHCIIDINTHNLILVGTIMGN
jgi:hypothetical protein